MPNPFRYAKKITSSLYIKISFITIGALCVLSLALAWLMQSTMKELIARQLEQRGYETALLIATLNTNDILLNDTYNILTRIKQVKDNNPNIRYILVCNYQGQVIAHTFMNGLPHGLPTAVSTKVSEPYQSVKFNSNEGEIYEITVPIEDGNVGFIRIGVATADMHLLLQNELEKFFLIICVIFVVTVILSITLASIIINPLRRLTGAVNELSNFNYAVQADCNTNDEIGYLAHSFNSMARSLAYAERENTQLVAALRKKEADHKILIQKLFTAQEDERCRLSRELHDGAGQSVTSILAYLRIVLKHTTDEQQTQLLLAARDVVVGVLGELRQMAVNLRPPVLDKFGVVAAIEKHLTLVKEQHGLQIQFTAPHELRLADTPALALYRILQESMTNVVRHAAATSVAIDITQDDTQIQMTITDDGRGFPVARLKEYRHTNHLGIYGMEERVELLGGTFYIASSLVGTKITVKIPRQKD